MYATHWLIGCTLCIVSVGAAATTSGEAQDTDGSAHAAVDGGSLRDGGSASGSDVLGLTRDSSQRSTGAETPAGTSSSGGDRASSAPASPARAHQAHVGWQSLLPGSIQ